MTALHSKKSKIRNNNVWSAAYNPDGGAIDPPKLPDGACVPDLPGDKGCGLFDPDRDYEAIIDPAGALCTNVCAAYEESEINSSSIQVGYTCDATLCTTLGIGQENNTLFPPPRDDQILLLDEACSGIQDTNGMKQIILVEALAECSCCASQVCECDNINQPTNQVVSELNQQQRKVSIDPQCDINVTLCGKE